MVGSSLKIIFVNRSQRTSRHARRAGVVVSLPRLRGMFASGPLHALGVAGAQPLPETAKRGAIVWICRPPEKFARRWPTRETTHPPCGGVLELDSPREAGLGAKLHPPG